MYSYYYYLFYSYYYCYYDDIVVEFNLFHFYDIQAELDRFILNYLNYHYFVIMNSIVKIKNC